MTSRFLCPPSPEALLQEGNQLLDRCYRNASEYRDEARRLLIQFLDERELHLTVFMARKFFLNAVITTDDLSYFMTTVRLALENGHVDIKNN